uniref:SFR19-like C-terminal domain-containing protein n=1 Tax=Oryctolagus cuniculus TaxID=9986 RepID=G1TJP9_RABIT
LPEEGHHQGRVQGHPEEGRGEGPGAVTTAAPAPQICHSKSGEINPVKVSNLVRAYVQRYRYFRKHGRKPGDPPGPPRPPKEPGPPDKGGPGLPLPPL